MTDTLIVSRTRELEAAARGRASDARAAFNPDGLFARVLERIPDVVLLVDRSAGIRYANMAARAYSVRAGENLLESGLIHEEDRAAARATWHRLLDMPGQTVSTEVRLFRNGEWPRVIVTGENLLADARVGLVLITATDALRRHELEWRVQQAQRIEAIGRLAGGVAHDFNNFLTTIQGLTQLVSEHPSLPAECRADLEEVLHAAERASAVTRRLLAFSRRQVLRPQQVDVNARLDEARATIVRLLGEEIVVGVEAAASDGNAFVDPAQLEQILLNLALNARDALPTGGVVTLSTSDFDAGDAPPFRHAYAVRPGRYLRLDVSDSGPGIPKHLREQVFEPFFTTKSAESASGLGLSTVYGIVKQSGGYVWIDDATCGGARVSILLPRAEAGSGGAASVLDVDPAAQRGGTVLVAEDDSTVRFLARRVLAREGYTVLEAADGERAAQICADYPGPIDLLLSDVMMPGMNGRELAEHCRRERPDLAVLFMSGYQDDLELRHGVGSGEQELIEKPFHPHALAQRVHGRIAARRARLAAGAVALPA
ncbi:MAG TPA: response regulator [Longimicrobiales bacterium]